MLRLIKICVAAFISVFAFSSINANESVSAVAVSLSLIQNGGFEEADFSGNYTLNISKATGWGSNNTSDGNSLSGVSGNGVAKTGEYSLGLPGATLGYFTDIEARSGDNFAFLLTRKSGGALVDNYIQSSSFSVSQSGLYEFSCGLKNGAKDHGRGAMIAIDIVQGQETVSAYSYTIPVEGQDWHLVENQVDLQPGEYFVRFKVIKEGTTENKDQARVCIDDVSLSGKYKTASEIFASASAGGLTAKLSKDIDIFNSVSVESGKKLTIDANGKKVSGAIDVSGEFTILNGDFSGCDVSVQPGGIVFLGAGTAIGSTNGFHVLDGAVACPKPEGGFIVIPRSSAEACANETVYQYVEDAFSMAQAGDTILLLSDASISDELTIDKDLTLAGGEHVFSSSSENAVMVVDGATLTVMDGKFSGIAMVAANGIINISGGQFSATKVLSYMNSDAAQVEGSKAYVNISGGQFGDDCISAVGMIGDVKISDPSNLLSGTVDGNACKLDDVGYSTLDDALKAVSESAQTEFRLTILKGLVITDETQIVIPQNKRILYSGADKALVLRRSGGGSAGDIYVCGELVIEDGCFYDLPINIGIDNTRNTDVKYPGAKLTVNGGDFHNVTMTSYGLDQSDNYIDSVYVNGGTFRDYSKMAAWNYSVFHLTGGKYFVKNNWRRTIHNRAFLYGGIYLAGSPEIAASQDTADRPMLGEGYKVKTITDSVNGGTYYIIAKETTTALNWNTGKVYDNLADAVDDADDGDEIRYFANIENEKEVFIPKNKRIILSATGDFTANAPFLVRGCLILKSVGFTGLFRFGGPGEIITYQDPGDLNVDGASFTRLDDDKWHARCRGFSVIIR